jgi:hypothetical protein
LEANTLNARLELLSSALKLTKSIFEKHPEYFTLESIIAQLEYLIDFVEGRNVDKAVLQTIIIGRMIAYDLQNIDNDMAESLFKVSAEVKRMIVELYE